MPRIQAGREQAIGRDNRKIEVVLNGDKSRLGQRIEFGDRRGIRWIDYRQIGGFQDSFRLEVAHFVQLMGNIIERSLPDNLPDYLLAADSDSVHLGLRGGPS